MSRSQTDKRTHTAPHTRAPPPRLGGKETRGWSSPKEGVQTRMENGARLGRLRSYEQERVRAALGSDGEFALR